jgi:hypothetical protein
MTRPLSAETWHIAPQIVDDEIVILNDCNSVIAIVPLWNDEGPDAGLEQQSRQNAALIAALPDMLEALEWCDMALADIECSKRKGYLAQAIKLTRAARAKTIGGAA